MTETTTSPASPPKERKSLGSRATRIGLLFIASLIALFLLYRFAGTSHIRGTVQRVYEKDREFRAEVVDEKGEVHVVSNQEIFFSYLKVDTADLHAELNRHAQIAALVDLKIWVFAWLGSAPSPM